MVFRFGKGVTCIAVHTGHIANVAFVGLSGQNMCSELECTGGKLTFRERSINPTAISTTGLKRFTQFWHEV